MGWNLYSFIIIFTILESVFASFFPFSCFIVCNGRDYELIKYNHTYNQTEINALFFLHWIVFIGMQLHIKKWPYSNWWKH